MSELPRYIALSGNPTCGKTTAAEILEELFGYRLVDDGAPLRKMAMDLFGATWEDVHTQEGKLRTTFINGVVYTWRDVLGRLGNGLEAQFGPDVIPELAYNETKIGERVIFGSVRREQGFYHRKAGALVIELRNPLAGPSAYEFDYFNADSCHVVIENDALAKGMAPPLARADLASKLIDVIGAAAGHVEGMEL